jgi:hypothetical protein
MPRYELTDEDRKRSAQNRRIKGVSGRAEGKVVGVWLPINFALDLERIDAQRRVGAKGRTKGSAGALIRDFMMTKGCRARIDELCHAIDKQIFRNHVNQAIAAGKGASNDEQ